MEKLRLGSKEGSSKVTGVLVCFGGALLISLYKGKVLLLGRAIVRAGQEDPNVAAAGPHHLRGTLLLLGNCMSYACWYPIQVRFVVAGVFSERRLTPLTFYIFHQHAYHNTSVYSNSSWVCNLRSGFGW
jgi:hypothetical protein